LHLSSAVTFVMFGELFLHLLLTTVVTIAYNFPPLYRRTLCQFLQMYY
jgi:hypothetical protein